MTGHGTSAPPAGREVVARAPGRVNLIGEHTDYNGGLVLPMAIDRGVTARVVATARTGVELTSAQVAGEVQRVGWPELAPGSLPGWAAYAGGAVWSLMAAQGIDPAWVGGGLSIEIDGDVPLGAGLSSSAAVECAVVTAVADLWNLPLPPRELARIAQRAENDFVGVPTGPMDQVASMMATAGHAVLFDVRADSTRQVPFDVAAHGLTLMVIDTRAAHALVDGGYAARRAACEESARLLGVATLRDVADVATASAALVSAGAPDELVRRTRHVVSEIARVEAAVVALGADDLRGFGSLMDASHASLREDFEVSCAELDLAVVVARGAGAWGARMTGGGFGGSAIALVPSAAQEAVAHDVAEAFAAAGFATPRVWAVAPSAGAAVLHRR